MNYNLFNRIIILFPLFISMTLFASISFSQIKTNSKYQVIKGEGAIHNLKISKDAKIIAHIERVGSGEENIITVLKVNNKLIDELFKIKLNGLRCNFDISPTSDKIIVAHGKNKYELWDIAKKKMIKTWNSEHECSDIVFTNDGCFFVELNAYSWGRQPSKLFELSTLKEVYRFQPSYHGVGTAYFSEDGSKIYCGGEGEIYVINSKNGQIIKQFEGYHGGLSCNVKYNSFMDKIFSYNRQDLNINIINPESGKREKYLKTDDYRHDYSFSPDNKYVAYSLDNKIYLYNIESNISEPILDANEKLMNFKVSSDFSYGVGYNEGHWASGHAIYIVDLKNNNIDSKFYSENFNSLINNLDLIYKSIIPRDEFETIDQFQEKIALDNQKIKETYADNMNIITNKKNGVLNVANDKTEKENEIIMASIRDTTLKIELLGRYNIDNHLLPVTIAGITKSITIAPEDAKNLKTNLPSAFVRSKKKLNYNLKDWVVYDLFIVDVIANKEYYFK